MTKKTKAQAATEEFEKLMRDNGATFVTVEAKPESNPFNELSEANSPPTKANSPFPEPTHPPVRTVDMFAWQRAVIASPLDPAEKFLLMVISVYFNRRKGYAYPSADLLRQNLGCSRATIFRHLKQVIEKGWLERSSRKGKFANYYYPAHPQNVQLRGEKTPPQQSHSYETETKNHSLTSETEPSQKRGVTVSKSGGNRLTAGEQEHHRTSKNIAPTAIARVRAPEDDDDESGKILDQDANLESRALDWLYRHWLKTPADPAEIVAPFRARIRDGMTPQAIVYHAIATLKNFSGERSRYLPQLPSWLTKPAHWQQLFGNAALQIEIDSSNGFYSDGSIVNMDGLVFIDPKTRQLMRQRFRADDFRRDMNSWQLHHGHDKIPKQRNYASFEPVKTPIDD